MVGEWRQQKTKTVPESILEFFSFNFQVSAEDWIFGFCCEVWNQIQFLTTLQTPAQLLLSTPLVIPCPAYICKSLSTCKNETMKEAKTIAQARQPPSFGDPTSITCLLSATSLNRVLVWENKEIYRINSDMLPVRSCSSFKDLLSCYICSNCRKSPLAGFTLSTQFLC